MRDDRRDSDNVDLDAILKDIAILKQDIGKLMDQVATGAVVRQRRGAPPLRLARRRRRTFRAAIAQQVEERPIASLLVAFAVGFIGSRSLMR